jgi:hypothetical protein
MTERQYIYYELVAVRLRPVFSVGDLFHTHPTQRNSTTQMVYGQVEFCSVAWGRAS